MAGKEMRGNEMRGRADMSWKERKGKMDSVSNQCKSVPLTVITLVCVTQTHTQTHTQAYTA